MMKTIFLSCVIACAAAIFFPYNKFSFQRRNMINVCIYSTNVTRYQPKCFFCLNEVYPRALSTCTGTMNLPDNISYENATCLERNCRINFPRGKRSSEMFRVEGDYGYHISAPSDFDSIISDLQNPIFLMAAEDVFWG